jgi:hypothetical protein
MRKVKSPKKVEGFSIVPGQDNQVMSLLGQGSNNILEKVGLSSCINKESDLHNVSSGLRTP